MNGHRGDYTVFSGFAHPGHESAGHNSESSFLTGATNPQLPGFRNSISLDQFVAEKLGAVTRFPSLILGLEGSNISVNRSGVTLPADTKPSKIFAKLFLEGTADEIQQEMDRLNEGRSILDEVSDEAKRLGVNVGASDRAKLDEYFTSVREMEQRLAGDAGLVAQAQAQGQRPRSERRAERRRHYREDGRAV